MSDRRVLLVGWEGADWSVLSPLLEAGQMPSLESVVDGGVMGGLATPEPLLCPLLWASAATGQRADRHGVLGWSAPQGWSARSLWEIAGRAGLSSIVVAWPATHPAPSIEGVLVSEAYPGAPASEGGPMPEGCVHPAGLAGPLAGLRVHPAELGAGTLVPFVPDLAAAAEVPDPRLAALRLILAECASVHAAATWLMEHEAWDLFAVRYRALGAFAHGFMEYHPPRMPHVDEGDFARYGDVVSAACRFHDLMLGRLLDLAGSDAMVVVVSDHGFQHGDLRPAGPARGPLEAFARWHRAEAMLAMRGPGIRKDERVWGAGLLDVAPTVLALLGLPAAEDVEGRPIADAFESPPAAGTVPSWETDRAPRATATPLEGDEAERDRTWALASVHLGAERPAEAAALLERLAAARPDDVRARLLLAQARYTLGDLEACERLVDDVLWRGGEHPPLALMLHGALLIARGRIPEGIDRLGEAERAADVPPRLHAEIGLLHAQLGRWPDAERVLRRAIAADPTAVTAHEGLAAALLEQSRAPEAVEAALAAVRLRHDSARAQFLLGVALARTGQTERAVRALETSLRYAPEGADARAWLARLGRQEAR